MSLNDLRGEFADDITQIAVDLSNSLPMSKPQLRSAFSDDELKELHEMIAAVHQATSEHDKQLALADNAKSVLALLKTLGVGV